jgi:glycosyltransferase involved in cell wall biosynthesis
VDAHFALYAFAPKLLGWFRRRPLIVHFQGPWADESVVAGDGAVKAWVKRSVERAVYRDARGTIVLSNAFKRLLVERYRVSPWSVCVIRPGVDLDGFCPGDPDAARKQVGIPAGARVVVTVRRLVPRMGIDVLLRAWPGIVNRYPDAVLAVVGDGPARRRLEELAGCLGISGSVRFVGRIEDPRLLVAWYRAAEVSVVPSTALEGYGLIVLESLACGTPVVATDVGGLPEALAPLDPTLVVRAGDVSALESRLVDALDGQGNFPTAEECRAYAEEFSWSRAAQARRAFYESALKPERARKLRVVYLDHCAQLSGGELALLRLLRAFDDVERHVILAEHGPLVSRLLASGISVEVMPLARRARTLRRHDVRPSPRAIIGALQTVLYAGRLAVRLRRLGPDLVHTNSLKAALYGGVAARIAGVPVIWHARDRIADDYLPPAAVRLVRVLARRIPRAVIANSRETLASLGSLRTDATVVPSPVDVDAFGRTDPQRSESLRFAIVGRLSPWKGQHVFLDAFARAFPNGEEHAVVVGAPLFGEEDYERRLREQGAALGLDGRLEFRGFRDDVRLELQRADVLVNASAVPEPFGQVVVEGMAAGLPVVAPNAGGPAEVIDDGVTGILYEPNDAEALAQALRLLARDGELRRRLGEAGRLHARRFAPAEVATAVAAVYHDVLPALVKEPA